MSPQGSKPKLDEKVLTRTPPRRGPEPVAFPLLSMRWERLAMVHWRYDADVVQRLLPRGLLVDRFEDRAWVSLTPFTMASVRGLGAVALPPAAFPETNLRTYVRLPDGPSGLWFFSLDVTAPYLLAGRAIGVRYRWADLTVRERGADTFYGGRRRGAEGVGYRMRIRAGAPVEELSPLDDWLTSRWVALSRGAGLLWLTPVHHEPWTLRHGTVGELEQTLTRSAGLPDPEPSPLVHVSPGVGPVRLGPSRPVF
ncbi:YqjF family protein [Streptomyces sp. NPDC059071]|uniref:YqjF family protein n=1 Tax=unclassified Streptomyces TaxID=2593676 RepID=UPI0036294646